MNLMALAASGRSEVVDISAADHTFSAPTRGISFATAGDLIVMRKDGRQDTFASGTLAAGVIHPIEAAAIKKVGTTAATIVGHL